jgi:glutathione S-transferase
MLYHIPKSVSSPIVQCLVELGLVGDSLVANELSFADIKESSYLDINPMGTAPTFQDGDVIIWESGAVLTYLLERYDTHHKLHPASLSTTSTPAQIADRAKFLHLQHFIAATVYPFMASLYIHSFKPTKQQDADYVECSKK